MFDWILNRPVQTDTLVTMWKENISSLQSTRCNEVWNWIKDEVNKVGLKKNLLQCKNKIRNSKEAYKEPRKKTDRRLTWISDVFLICSDKEMSGKSRSSNQSELIIEKLKPTTTMNRLRLVKKGKIEKLEKKMRTMGKFSSYFISKFSWTNLSP